MSMDHVSRADDHSRRSSTGARQVAALLLALAVFAIPTLAAAAPEKRSDSSQKKAAAPSVDTIAEGALPSEAASVDIPPLPDLRDTEHTLYISTRNVSLFHELLLAPVAQWLKEGKLLLRAVRDLPNPLRHSPAWLAQSKLNGATSVLKPNGDIEFVGATLDAPGAPFGNLAELRAEMDPEILARKLLWNTHFAQAPYRDALYTFDMYWFSPQAKQKRASGSWYSYLPADATKSVEGGAAALGPGPGAMLRLDVLSFQQPAAIAGFSQLSARAFDARDDRTWIYSPVIAKSREVLTSNRSDPLFGSLVNFDDFFPFSIKPQSVTARVIEERTLLVALPASGNVPLEREAVDSASVDLLLAAQPAVAPPTLLPPNAAPTPAPARENVLTAHGVDRGSGEHSFAVWNFESNAHSGAPPWIPTSAVFVPRKVWILEVSGNDPFYLLGRQILVIDQESQLPMYKVVYDRRGVYTKTLVAGWTFAVSASEEYRVPVLSFLLAIDRRMSIGIGISTSSFRTFAGKDTAAARTIRKHLDIKSYDRNAGASGAGPTPSPVEEVDE